MTAANNARTPAPAEPDRCGDAMVFPFAGPEALRYLILFSRPGDRLWLVVETDDTTRPDTHASLPAIRAVSRIFQIDRACEDAARGPEATFQSEPTPLGSALAERMFTPPIGGPEHPAELVALALP
jgi:hypothetical protein